MSENENKVCPVSCKIEHHAMMFAFLAKHAIELCGEAGKDAILAGMTTYGNERGARMAANALAHGDELTTMTNQAYGEWKTRLRRTNGLRNASHRTDTSDLHCKMCMV